MLSALFQALQGCLRPKVLLLVNLHWEVSFRFPFCTSNIAQKMGLLPPPLTWVTAELGSHCSLRPAMSHISDLAAVTRSGREKDNVMSMSFKKCVSDPDLIL